MKIEKGENVFYLDLSKLDQYFNLKKVDIDILSSALCDKIIYHDRQRSPIVRTDPVKRVLEYKSLIDSGVVKNQSVLAVYLGTSRAWVSKALSALKRIKD